MEKEGLSPESESDVREEISETMRQLNLEISGENPFSPYLAAYNQMFAEFDNCYSKNVKLMEICGEMNDVIIANARKLHEILETTSRDGPSLESMAGEYERAQTILKQINSSEQERKIEIRHLMDLAATMKSAVSGVKSEEDQEVMTAIHLNRREISGLEKQIASVRQELEADQQCCENLKEEIETGPDCVAEISKELEESLKKNDDIRSEIASLNAMIENHENVIENWSSEREAKNADVAKRESEFSDVNFDRKMAADESSRLQLSLIRKPKLVQKLRAENVEADQKITKLADALLEARRTYECLLEEVKMFRSGALPMGRDFFLLRDKREKLGQTRIDVKTELRDQYSEKIRLMRELNRDQTIADKREISSKYHDISDVKREIVDEVHSRAEAENKLITISQSTITMRERLGGERLRSGAIENTIGSNLGQIREVSRRITTVEEGVQDIEMANREALKKLGVVREDVQSKYVLIGKVKEEISLIKRNLTLEEKEHEDLETGFQSVMEQVATLSSSMDIISDRIEGMRKRKEALDSASEYLAKMHGTCEDGIKKTLATIADFASDHQSLNKLLFESNRAYVRQKRESSTIVAKTDVLRNSLHAKELETEKVFVSIDSIMMRMKEYEKLYDEKMTEIFSLQVELEVQDQKTLELRRKIETVKALDYQHRSLVEFYEVAKEARNGIAFQGSLKVCVMNPTTKEWEYMKYLRERFAVADREYQDLVKVRNDLKNEFELRRSKRVVEFSGDDEVRREIEALQEALKKQNEDMQEMKEDMETCRFRDSGLATVQARLEITKRKALTGSLRRSNQNFITEPPVVREISLGNYGNLIPRFSTMSVIGKSYEALTPRALYNLGAPLVKIPVNGRSARRPKD